MGRMRRSLALLGAVSLLVLGCSGAASEPVQSGPPAPSPAAGSGKFKVETVTAGLEHGWDVGFLPGGDILVPQRPGKLPLGRNGRATEVRADFSDVLVQGEGGLLGMVVSPDFATSREFITCQDHKEGGKAVAVRLV